jgi:prepilin-type N-terminal cleavage/methylation domain-containing protein
MMARARNEAGMTLPELLTTLTIALIVSLATFSLIEVTMRQSGEVAARVDAVQRGRGAMDAITRQLRSQVCLANAAWPAGTDPRSIEAATTTSVTFYADLRDTSVVGSATPAPGAPQPIVGPERRELALENGTIVERRWAVTALTTETFTYAAAPTGQRNLLENVDLVPLDGAPAGSAPVLFRYFAYDTHAAIPQPTIELLPNAGTNALAPADLDRVAKIEIRYRAQPEQQRAGNRASTVFENEVAARTVDPNADPTELAQPCL